MESRLQWKLGPYLKAHNLTAYALEKALKGGVSRNLPYEWARAKAPPLRLHTETLERVLAALESLTGKTVTVCDLLEFAPAGGERSERE